MELLVLLFGVVGLAVYFLPTIVAFKGGKQNRAAILVLNLLMGWTMIGWLGALIWAMVSPEE